MPRITVFLRSASEFYLIRTNPIFLAFEKPGGANAPRPADLGCTLISESH